MQKPSDSMINKGVLMLDRCPCSPPVDEIPIVKLAGGHLDTLNEQCIRCSGGWTCGQIAVLKQFASKVAGIFYHRLD